MNTSTRCLSFVGLIAALFIGGAGCASEPGLEEAGSTESHLDQPVYLGSHLELVDVSPDKSLIPQRHRFELRAVDKRGNRTQLHPGESVYFKISPSLLALFATSMSKPDLEEVSLRLSYYRADEGSGDPGAADRREASTATNDFISDGWTTSAFTIPRGFVKAEVALDVHGNHDAFAIFELGETLDAPAADEVTKAEADDEVTDAEADDELADEEADDEAEEDTTDE